MEYLNFYKLKEDPFGITPDPDFFYPSKLHSEAIQSMEYFIKKGESFMLLTGEPGTGKTTLIKTFLKNFNEASPVVIYHSTLSTKDFLKTLIKNFAKEEMEVSEKLEKFLDKIDLFNMLTEVLEYRKIQGIKNLVIIDEAQDLPEETLVEIKHISNLETEKEKLIHFILLAQPYFENLLKSHAQLNQRISLRVRINPLSREETESYIKFRLQRAGDPPIVFKNSAIKAIHKKSKGIPRLINLICSRALMVGYLESSYMIKKSFVKVAVKHLNL
ncbi:MAG: AAA family ATPase [Thermodesulfovibrio sp.]|nr:AAA family ATPase [Thermodesulfovibrio sp.]